MHLSLLRRKRKGASAKSKSAAKKWSSMGETYDKNLFNLLKGWRLAESGSKGVPAYRVLPDRALVSLASLKPMTESELLEVHGIGLVGLRNTEKNFSK